MRQKTKNHQNQGSIDKKCDFFPQSLSHIHSWVHLVQKTQAKNSHAWAPLNNIQADRECLKVPKREIFVTELFILSDPIWVGDLRN